MKENLKERVRKAKEELAFSRSRKEPCRGENIHALLEQYDRLIRWEACRFCNPGDMEDMYRILQFEFSDWILRYDLNDLPQGNMKKEDLEYQFGLQASKCLSGAASRNEYHMKKVSAHEVPVCPDSWLVLSRLVPDAADSYAQDRDESAMYRLYRAIEEGYPIRDIAMPIFFEPNGIRKYDDFKKKFMEKLKKMSSIEQEVFFRDVLKTDTHVTEAYLKKTAPQESLRNTRKRIRYRLSKIRVDIGSLLYADIL